MYQLRITVIHALGTFSGHLQLRDEEASEENAIELSEGIQTTINKVDRLVLMQHDGTEVAFPEKILRESIFIFKVEEIE